MSVLCVVCCEVEVSATGRSPVQKSPTECGVCVVCVWCVCVCGVCVWCVCGVCVVCVCVVCVCVCGVCVCVFTSYSSYLLQRKTFENEESRLGAVLFCFVFLASANREPI
jgi:hypothetical protein